MIIKIKFKRKRNALVKVTKENFRDIKDFVCIKDYLVRGTVIAVKGKIYKSYHRNYNRGLVQISGERGVWWFNNYIDSAEFEECFLGRLINRRKPKENVENQIKNKEIK